MIEKINQKNLEFQEALVNQNHKKALEEAVIDTSDASSFDYVQQSGEKLHINFRLLDAYLRYYMHIKKPHKLRDVDWCEEVQNLHFIRTKEKESSQL